MSAILRVLALLAVAALGLVLTSAAVADERLVTPDFQCCTMLTESLDGVVEKTLPLPTFPYEFEGIADGTVVFRGGEGDNHNGVWLVKPGHEPVHLTNYLYDFDPTITYDGSKVAFSRFNPVTSAADIYVINADGTGLTEIASGGGITRLSQPEFSPDGKTIAYVCFPATPMSNNGVNCGPLMDGSYRSSGVLLMNPDGTNKRLILRAAGEGLSAVEGLNWSPDAKWLAMTGFVSVSTPQGVTGIGQIFRYKSDGSDLFRGVDPDRQVTHEPLPWSALLPSFSSDSRQIFFFKTVDDEGNGGQFAFLINVDGSNRRQLHMSGWPYARFVPPAVGGVTPVTIDATHVRVPPVRRLTYARAKRKLRRAHLTVGSVHRKYFAHVRRGHVVSQRPRAGAIAHRTQRSGPPVALVVSRGKRR